MATSEEDPKVQQRMKVILAHLAGQINATQAAQAMDVSRPTFYGWRKRARTAVLSALVDRPTGRPPQPVDPQKEELRSEVEHMKLGHCVLENRLRIQEAIGEVLGLNVPGESKKKGEA
jgi:transposase